MSWTDVFLPLAVVIPAGLALLGGFMLFILTLSDLINAASDVLDFLIALLILAVISVIEAAIVTGLIFFLQPGVTALT